MNLAIINIKNLDINKLGLDVKYNLTSNSSSYEDKFADIAIQLDELIYINNQKIDLVVVYTSDFDSANLKEMHNDDESLRFLDDLMIGTFYCRPEIISLLAGVKKLKEENYKFKNIEQRFNMTNDYHKFMVKILYLAQRLGIPIYVN